MYNIPLPMHNFNNNVSYRLCYTFLLLNLFSIFKTLLTYVFNSVLALFFPEERKPMTISTTSRHSLICCMLPNSFTISVCCFALSCFYKKNIYVNSMGVVPPPPNTLTGLMLFLTLYQTKLRTWGDTFLLMLAKASAVYISFLYTTCGISSCMSGLPSMNRSRMCFSSAGRS